MDTFLSITLMAAVVIAAAALLIWAVDVSRRRRGESAAGIPQETLIGEAVSEAVEAALAQAMINLRVQSAGDRDNAVSVALERAAILQREQVTSVATLAREQAATELGSKKDLIDARLGQVHEEMRTELDKLSAMVRTLADTSSERFGQVDRSLRAHAEITQTLSDTAQALRSAMASSSARGQWGERMAEDVLRVAGFIENVNYVKQTQLDGAMGRPDFTFPMPKGQELYMDVKFPMAAYLRYLEATTDAERQAQLAMFLRDVRARIKELAKRDYARESAAVSVDYVLLFIPNEQLTSFIHENDSALMDEAMQQRIVLCSPLTLFALLGVIRQAHDNFTIEKTSDEILTLIGRFGNEWEKYSDRLDKLKKKFDQVDSDFGELTGTRRRALERPLRQLDAIRRERNLPIDGELFPTDEIGIDDGGFGAIGFDDTDDATPPNVRRLGA